MHAAMSRSLFQNTDKQEQPIARESCYMRIAIPLVLLLLTSSTACSNSEAIDGAGSAGRAGTIGGAGSSSPTDASAFSPKFYDDFESYAVGASLSSNGFDAAGRSTVTDEQAANGKQSARMAIAPEDGGGYGQWGAVVPILPAVT